MYKIIQDTREKRPLDFSFYEAEVTVAKLNAGDYTAEGLEDKLFIERKANSGELCNNFGSKRRAFFDELDRAKDMPYKYIVCEFSYADIMNFPKNSGIPNRSLPYVRMNSGYMKKTIESIEIEYGITFFFCGTRERATNKIIEIIHDCKEKEQ